MNLIVPFGSSILGAIIGGAFLLVGQRWNNRLTCQNNSKVVFIAFYRQALHLNGIIRTQLNSDSRTSTAVIFIDVNTKVFHDAEKVLAKCVDFRCLDSIYIKVADIDLKQNSIINSAAGPDEDVSYGYLLSIQSGLIEILDILKPYCYPKSFFHQWRTREIHDIEQAIQNFKSTHSSLTKSNGRFRFILTHPMRT